MTQSLPQRIRDYIVACTETKTPYVTMQQIIDVAGKKGISKTDVLDALKTVHKYKDIQTSLAGGIARYRLRPAPKPIVLDIKPVPRKDMEAYHAITNDTIDNCPFVSDTERACLAVRWEDRDDECHRLLSTPQGFKRIMERKYGAEKFKRLEEERVLAV